MVDLTHVKLLIASPTLDGKFEEAYQVSMLNTAHMLDGQGVKWERHVMPYCSDIALARNRIINGFYRDESYTHILFIDADMGWNPFDILRMLALKRDFIAAAGPKKTDTPSFAVSFTDKFGHQQPIVQETGTGLFEASEVGGAFVLLTRSCVGRMMQSYADLAYRTEQQIEIGLFMPFIQDMRYYSEDWAFCYRWRKLGGKVWVLPDVRMKHVGIKTWEGAFVDMFQAPPSVVTDEEIQALTQAQAAE